MKSSGRPGSSRKLAFLCPLLVKPPSAFTQDFDEITTIGELDRAVDLRAEDSGLGVQTEVSQGRSLCILAFSVHMWNKQLPGCVSCSQLVFG